MRELLALSNVLLAAALLIVLWWLFSAEDDDDTPPRPASTVDQWQANRARLMKRRTS